MTCDAARNGWVRLHLVRTTSAGGRYYALVVVVVFVIHSFGVWTQYTHLMKTTSNSTETGRQKLLKEVLQFDANRTQVILANGALN